jgi:hypothetical protein
MFFTTIHLFSLRNSVLLLLLRERWGLCMFGTAAGNGPIVQPPDYTRVNVEQRWNDINRGTEGLCERPVPVS